MGQVKDDLPKFVIKLSCQWKSEGTSVAQNANQRLSVASIY